MGERPAVSDGHVRWRYWNILARIFIIKRDRARTQYGHNFIRISSLGCISCMIFRNFLFILLTPFLRRRRFFVKTFKTLKLIYFIVEFSEFQGRFKRQFRPQISQCLRFKMIGIWRNNLMDEILYKSSYPPKNATILGFTPYTLFQFVLSHLRLLLVRLKMVQLTQENIEISVFTSMMSKKAVRLVIGLQIQAEL